MQTLAEFLHSLPEVVRVFLDDPTQLLLQAAKALAFAAPYAAPARRACFIVRYFEDNQKWMLS